MNRDNIVYDRSELEAAESGERKSPNPPGLLPSAQTARIRRESQGRGGKQVTVIGGLAGSADYLKGIASALKAACGAGGTLKQGSEGPEIEIQGDQRERVETWLKGKGYQVKRVGG